jgi:hypothetical protein
MKKHTILKTIFISAFIFTAGMVSATCYFVASTGSDTNNGLSTCTPFVTLTYSLSKALDGVIINIYYFVNVSGENAGAGVNVTKNVSIIGSSTSKETCGLDGDYIARVAQINVKNVVFQNLIIKNRGPSIAIGHGAGVKVSGSATTQVLYLIDLNSTFKKNVVAASSDTGAINLYSSLRGIASPSVNISNTTITENTTAGGSGHGAGIRIIDNQYLGVVNINNSIIEGNVACQTAAVFSDLSTGSIVSTAFTLMIHNSIIVRNGNVAVPAECYLGNDHFNYLTSTSTTADLIGGLGTFSPSPT